MRQQTTPSQRSGVRARAPAADDVDVGAEPLRTQNWGDHANDEA